MFSHVHSLFTLFMKERLSIRCYSWFFRRIGDTQQTMCAPMKFSMLFLVSQSCSIPKLWTSNIFAQQQKLYVWRNEIIKNMPFNGIHNTVNNAASIECWNVKHDLKTDWIFQFKSRIQIVFVTHIDFIAKLKVVVMQHSMILRTWVWMNLNSAYK